MNTAVALEVDADYGSTTCCAFVSGSRGMTVQQKHSHASAGSLGAMQGIGKHWV